MRLFRFRPLPRGQDNVTPYPCLRKAWRQQLDNPALPIVVYLGIVGALGLLAGGVAPDVVEATTPRWLTLAWPVSLAVGGGLAAAGGLTGRTRAESAGLALQLFGLGLFGLAAAVTNWPLSFDTISALAALMACLWMRMRVLRLARRAVCLARREVHRWTS